MYHLIRLKSENDKLIIEAKKASLTELQVDHCS